MSNELDYDELDELLDITKARLFLQPGTGFLGSLLCQLDFQWDEECETAWTDGASIGWNPRWFLSLDRDSRVFVLAHEVWHVAFQHMFRRGERDPKIWNYAGDYVINAQLKNSGFPVNTDHLYDKRFDGMSTNEIYDIIYSDPPEGSGIGNDIKECSGENKEEDGNGDGDGDGDASGRAKLEQASLNKLSSAVMSAQLTSSHAGDIPGEISTIIEDLWKPKLDWRKILRRFFNSLVESSYSFRRPNRRYQDPLMPGLVGTHGLEHLIYYLDISGSVSDKDIKRFNSEVAHIQRTLSPERLTLITFDTKLRDTYEFTKDEKFDSIKVTGRGGTCFFPVLDHINEHKPTAAVIFSDLFVNKWPAAPKKKTPVIWVCVGNKNGKAPFGKTIHLESEGY